MRRGNWLFFPFWFATLAYIGLSAAGLISRSWDKLFFPIFGLLFAINFVYGIVALMSAREDASRSQHPDQDVADLVDGRIDIAEYGRRKEAADREP